jgi:hypothetical protein
VILADIGKFVGAKVATAAIFLAVAGGGYWCYMHPEQLRTFGHVVKATIVWIAVAAVLPWSSFFFMRPLLSLQASMQSTQGAAALSVAMIGGFCLVDVVFALYLAGGGVSGALSWAVLLLGFLAAGAYNFVICESLARHVDS